MKSTSEWKYTRRKNSFSRMACLSFYFRFRRSVPSARIRWAASGWYALACWEKRERRKEVGGKGRELTGRKEKRERARGQTRRCRQPRLKCKGIHAAQPIYMRLAGPVLKSAGVSATASFPSFLSSLLLMFSRHPFCIIRGLRFTFDQFGSLPKRMTPPTLRDDLWIGINRNLIAPIPG